MSVCDNVTIRPPPTDSKSTVARGNTSRCHSSLRVCTRSTGYRVCVRARVNNILTPFPSRCRPFSSISRYRIHVAPSVHPRTLVVSVRCDRARPCDTAWPPDSQPTRNAISFSPRPSRPVRRIFGRDTRPAGRLHDSRARRRRQWAAAPEPWRADARSRLADSLA